MTKEEALRVLRLIAKAHLVTPDPELTEVWYNAALEKVDYELGLKIARDLAGSKDRMPKPAHFNEMLRARLRHPSHTVRLITDGDDDTKNPEIAKQHLAEMRAKLQR